MPGTIFLTGLYTGVDWDSVIDKIMQVEQKRIDVLEDQKSVYKNKLSAWQDLNTKVLNVQTQAEALSRTDAFNIFTTTLSASSGDPKSYVTATAGSEATAGVYEFTIKQLAAAKMDKTTNAFSSMTDALNWNGVLQLRRTGASEWTTITIETSDSLEDIKDKLNQVTDDTGVIASIVKYADNDYRLVLTAKDTGEANAFEINNAATITVDSTTYDNLALPSYLGLFSSTDASGNGANENIIQQAQNAIINIYGQDAERSSNTVTDLIPGVTLNLLQADENVNVTLQVRRDTDAIVGNIQNFIEAVNDVLSYINKQSTYTEGKEAPILLGDTTMMRLRSDITTTMRQYGFVDNDGNERYLFHIGIRLSDDNVYKINTSELTEAIENNFEMVVRLFTDEDTGIANRMQKLVENITDPYSYGYMESHKNEFESQIENINNRIEDIQDQMDKERDQLYQQFVTLEKYMAQMQQTQQWLSQQLSKLQ